MCLFQAGIRVAIHDSREYPLMEEFGFSAMTSTLVNISPPVNPPFPLINPISLVGPSDLPGCDRDGCGPSRGSLRLKLRGQLGGKRVRSLRPQGGGERDCARVGVQHGGM